MIRVFVYGTLLTGASAHGKIASLVRSASSGTVRGSLISAGQYPAMILGSGAETDVVHGEWLEVEEEALAVMDEWEAYYGPGDSRNEYERVRVTDTDGEKSGWAYVWNGDRGFPPIPGGSWRDYLAGI